MAALQQALLVPSGEGHHLFFVIHGPSAIPTYGNTPQVIMVCVCTLYDGLPHDAACLVVAGEHPFIQRPSYVSYRHMRIEAEPHVERMIQQNVWRPHEPCSLELHRRIVNNVCTSRLIAREFKLLLNCPPARRVGV